MRDCFCHSAVQIFKKSEADAESFQIPSRLLYEVLYAFPLGKSICHATDLTAVRGLTIYIIPRYMREHTVMTIKYYDISVIKCV